MNDVTIRKGNIFGKGVFAKRDFKKGEIVILYTLRKLTEKEFHDLPKKEKNFVHKHWGTYYLYSIPERYVNDSSNQNTLQNLKVRCDVAIRDIKKGEEITTDATKDNIQ
jgi:SET domain-containing protein